MDKELQHKTQFRIKHYAGDVVYSIVGFLDKNKDTLFQDFKRLMYKSKNTLLSGMWPEGAEDITKVGKRLFNFYKIYNNCWRFKSFETNGQRLRERDKEFRDGQINSLIAYN